MKELFFAKEVIHTLRSRGFNSYLVGGCVRDMIQGKPAHDFDIVTDATPDEIEACFPYTIPIGKAFGVINVVVAGFNYEVATLRKDGRGPGDGRHPTSITYTRSVEEDAARRDFTMNAIYLNPISDTIIDPVGGRDDISNKIIRFVGNPEDRLAEDKLRALRAIRFAARFGWEIETSAFHALCELGRTENPLAGVSWERIGEELKKILVCSGAARGIYLLHSTGLMRAIVPEFSDLFGCHQSPRWHAEGSVGIHSLLVLSHCESDLFVHRAACWLHDIGKIKALALKPLPDGTYKYTNKNHAAMGAEMALDICKRLKWSNADAEAIVEAVHDHMLAHDMAKTDLSNLKPDC